MKDNAASTVSMFLGIISILILKIIPFVGIPVAFFGLIAGITALVKKEVRVVTAILGIVCSIQRLNEGKGLPIDRLK